MDQELERLLKEVLDELKDLTKVLKGSGKAVTSFAGTLGKTRQVLERNVKVEQKKLEAMKKGTEEYKQQAVVVSQTTNALEEFEEATDKATKRTKNFGKRLLDMAKDIAMAGGKTALAFTDAARPIQGTSDIVSAGLADLGVAGDIAQAMASDLDIMTETFIAMSQSGAMFNGSMMAMSKAAADAAIPLPRFVDLVTQNSELLGAFFGTVQAGTNRFITLSRKINELSSTELAKFGISAEAAGEFMTTFIEGERRRGNIKNFTDAQLLNGTKAYIKQLQTLSVLTGKSVKELDEQNKAAMTDAVFNQKLAGMDAKAASAIRTQFNSLNPELQNFFKQIIAFEGPINRAGFELEVLSGNRLSDAVNTFIRTAADPEATLRFQNELGRISQEVRETGNPFADVAILSGEFTTAFQALNDTIRKQVDQVEINQVFERLAVDGEKAVKLLNDTAKINADFIDKRLNMTIPPTLAAFSKLGDIVAKSTEPPDGALYKFGEGLHAANQKIMELLGLGTPETSELDSDERFYKFMKPFVDSTKNFVTNKLGTDQAPGKGTIFSLADDGVFGYIRKGGEAVGDFMNSDFYKTLPRFQYGTNGFQDFGSGTPVMLHGSEAVVPENTTSQLLKELIAFGAPVSKATQQKFAGATDIQDAGMSSSFTALNNAVGDLIKTNKSMEQHLNTLVSIGAMTERNTKNVGNNLANLSSSVL